MGGNNKPKPATSATSGTPTVDRARTPEEDVEDGAVATTNPSQ